MNTDTTDRRTGRNAGRKAVRALAAVAFALLVLGATMGAADAKPYNAGNMSKGGFIAACEGVEGTVSTKGTVIKCSFPNGTSESCNFKNKKSVICNYIPLVAGETSGTHGTLTNGELDSGLVISTTDTTTVPLGGEFTTDDDTR